MEPCPGVRMLQKRNKIWTAKGLRSKRTISAINNEIKHVYTTRVLTWESAKIFIRIHELSIKGTAKMLNVLANSFRKLQHASRFIATVFPPYKVNGNYRPQWDIKFLQLLFAQAWLLHVLWIYLYKLAVLSPKISHQAKDFVCFFGDETKNLYK